MTVLERRYRSVLRLLPISYRQVWEEEMVATFLETMHSDNVERSEYLSDCGRPGWAEVGSVVSLAVRLRLGGAEAPPRSLAWGEAVRRVVLVGLLINAVAVTTSVIEAIWEAGRIGWPPIPSDLATFAATPWTGVWVRVSDLGSLLWVMAFLGLVVGHRRVAQFCAGLAILPGLAAATLSVVGGGVSGRGASTGLRFALGGSLFSFTWWYFLVVNVGLVLALVAFHRDAPPVRPRPWSVALGAGVALSLMVTLMVLLTVDIANPGNAVAADLPALLCLATVIGAACYLTLAPEFRAPSWALALSVMGVLAVGLRAVSLLEYVHLDSQRPAFIGPAFLTPVGLRLGLIEIVVVLAVVGRLATLARRMFRQLPVSAVAKVP
jgi:hypothetical protein